MRGSSSDKRQAKGRFGWVKRLMQGQGRQGLPNHAYDQRQNHVRRRRSNSTPHRTRDNGGVTTNPHNEMNRANSELQFENDTPNVKIVEFDDGLTKPDPSYYSDIDSDQIDNSSDDTRNRGTSILSDQITTHSDNLSTIPLKSIMSAPSSKSPSVLSGDNHHDNSSYVASTAETSLAPSVHTATTHNYTLYPGNASLHSNHPSINQNPEQSRDRDRDSTRERDSESIITLASSTRRVRRRSLDTNCSTAGIPPASIMERLSVHPNAANSSTYAMSIHNSNDRGENQSEIDNQHSP